MEKKSKKILFDIAHFNFSTVVLFENIDKIITKIMTC